MGRQVIDIRKDGEKVYVKNHAKVTFLSDGTNVEQRIIDVSNDLSTKVSKDYIDDILENIIIDSSQIDFNQLQNNPFVDNNSGKLEVMDESGNIIAKIDAEGIHSVDFIAGNHKLTDKIDSSALDGYATESYVNTNLQNYATKNEVSDLVDMSVVTELQGKVETLVGEDTDKSVRDIAVDVLTETLVSETATEAYDTLAEMSDWIKSHPEDASAMNTAIQKNAIDITNLDAAYKAADTKVLTDAQEYTNNINFYTIKDNPIVDGEAGSITFVDETGYIGLKFSEDGIIAKDVVTPEHTLSSKADKSFVEDNYYNKSTVDKKIAEAVTGGQVSLDGFATEQWVNEQGFLKEHQNISHLAEKSELPTKTSDLTNDSGFITISDVPEVIVPTKVSELENDKGYITASDIPDINIPSLDEYVKSEDLPNFDEFAKTEDIPSLDGYAKTSDIPSLDDYASKEWVNNKNYATEYDLKNIDYSSIKNVPASEDETGELNITDENGNIGMKVASEAVYAKDFVAGEHKLSEKVDKTYVDNSLAELVDGAPETLDTLNELAAALNDNADIVDVLNQSISNKQDAITDLETIRQGAAKGATALQSYTEQYKGTVTGVKINGTTKSPTSGVVDLGTVITDVSNLATKDEVIFKDVTGELVTAHIQALYGGGSVYALPDCDNGDEDDILLSRNSVKTINGESILGSGDITISGGSSDANVQAVDTGDVLDDVNISYATTAYVDGLIGDINSVLESIINS